MSRNKTQPEAQDPDLKQLAENLTSHGYGAPTDRIYDILSKLTPEERGDLMYTCKRAAEKVGSQAFYSQPITW
jgi:hypothetical protein